MKAAKKILTLLLIGSALIISTGRSLARERIAEGVFLDKTIHDFGDILLDEGPVSCTFTLVNESPSPVVIYSVVSSCGCTDVRWTREPVKTGGEGKITATYTISIRQDSDNVCFRNQETHCPQAQRNKHGKEKES